MVVAAVFIIALYAWGPYSGGTPNPSETIILRGLTRTQCEAVRKMLWDLTAEPGLYLDECKELSAGRREAEE